MSSIRTETDSCERLAFASAWRRRSVDVEGALDRAARDQRNGDHRLRLVGGGSSHGRGAWVEVSLIDADRLTVLDAPARQPDAEGTPVGEDLVCPLIARPDRVQHAARLVSFVDRQRVVRYEIGERVRDPVEQRVEALLGEDVVEDVGEASVRLDERRLTRWRVCGGRLGNEPQGKGVVAHRHRSVG
jgi:hypothetical protein